MMMLIYLISTILYVDIYLYQHTKQIDVDLYVYQYCAC